MAELTFTLGNQKVVKGTNKNATVDLFCSLYYFIQVNIDSKQAVSVATHQLVTEAFQNKGRYGTNHGLFRQVKTFRTVADCQVSYSP